MDPIAKVISDRKDILTLALQGLTTVGLVLTAILCPGHLVRSVRLHLFLCRGDFVTF
jgi:hypothetical protein